MGRWIPFNQKYIHYYKNENTEANGSCWETESNKLSWCYDNRRLSAHITGSHTSYTRKRCHLQNSVMRWYFPVFKEQPVVYLMFMCMNITQTQVSIIFTYKCWFDICIRKFFASWGFQNFPWALLSRIYSNLVLSSRMLILYSSVVNVHVQNVR